MRLLLHDFSGHPFQAQLARSLADRGHDVLHVQCSSYPSGKGSQATGDSGRLRFESICLDREFTRYHAGHRLLDELRYGRRFVATCREFDPDVVISCNDPLIAKTVFGVWAAVNRIRWIFWLQDVYSIAMTRTLERKLPFGRMVGRVLQAVERWLLQHAESVVSISDDFDAILSEWSVDLDDRTVIENWAPLDEVAVRPKRNAWSLAHGLDDRFVFLYAGTLGLKHNPDVLAQLALEHPDDEVVVVSEGIGAKRLRTAKERDRIENLRILDYQPWEMLPDVLGTADTLVVLLEGDAGVYSVPSKILTSLCAGRPILASMPEDNLGARTIRTAGAGLVVPPGEARQLMDAASRLRDDARLRQDMGAAARCHAERAFDIDDITDRFEAVLRHRASAVLTSGRIG